MQYLEVSVQPFTFDVCKYDMLSITIIQLRPHYKLNKGFVFTNPLGTYGMVVTVATVGYGDISPKTTLGRFAGL